MESDDKHIFRFEIIQVDISVKYLNFFLEDDAELEHIKKVRFLLFGWFDWSFVKIFGIYSKSGTFPNVSKQTKNNTWSASFF